MSVQGWEDVVGSLLKLGPDTGTASPRDGADALIGHIDRPSVSCTVRQNDPVVGREASLGRHAVDSCQPGFVKDEAEGCFGVVLGAAPRSMTGKLEEDLDGCSFLLTCFALRREREATRRFVLASELAMEEEVG